MTAQEIRRKCLVVLKSKEPLTLPEREWFKQINESLNTIAFQIRLAHAVAEILFELEHKNERLPSSDQHT